MTPATTMGRYRAGRAAKKTFSKMMMMGTDPSFEPRHSFEPRANLWDGASPIPHILEPDPLIFI